MKTSTLIIAAVVILLGVGGVAFYLNSAGSSAVQPVEQAPEQQAGQAMDSEMMEDPAGEAMEAPETMMDQNQMGDAMEEKEGMMEEGTDSFMGQDLGGDDGMMEEDSGMMMGAGQYVEYTQAAYDANADKKRVLFFHAAWCPTCKSADAEFNENVSEIPAGVVVMKADYDAEEALKTQYGVTYQHTFVQVDAQGNEIAKWNGGSTEELIANVQ